MKPPRRSAVAALIVSAVALASVSAQDGAERERTSARTADTRASTTRETVTAGAEAVIPNVPGKRLVSRIVDYPPGGKSVSHHHAPSAFIYAYVLSGSVRSQVNDEPARVYRAGETWFESPGAYHRVSENASQTEPARLLAVLIVDLAEKELTIPDAR